MPKVYQDDSTSRLMRENARRRKPMPRLTDEELNRIIAESKKDRWADGSGINNTSKPKS